jgi:hypothetical protein
MVKLKGGDPAEFELIPENDIVHLRVSDVQLHTFTWNEEDVEKLKWTFTVIDPGPWEGRDIFGDTSAKFTAHPNCKAYNWASAIMGAQPDAGSEFDTDDLIGMPCRGLIAHKVDRQQRTWMRIREVLPAQGASTAVDNPF